MDDGSTDNTKEIVEQFQAENIFPIEYFYNENAKKFYTTFKGIEKVVSPFFTILDSDDAYVDNGLEIMYDEISKLSEQEYISATFNSIYPDGKLVGTLFTEGLSGSILEMRYKYKVKGDKHTIFLTKKYLNYLKEFDYSNYKGKYAPQKIFFNIYDGKGEKSKFINKSIRIYYQDLDDAQSMSQDRVKPSSYFGLKEGHLSFLNSYGSQLFAYPKALLRNLVGYQFYSFKNKDCVFKILSRPKNLVIKTLGLFLLPLSFVYHLSK
jgi:glycosyltransferase involved in cell wall biosynthesis